MRTPLIMGNWKMNLSHREGVDLVKDLAALLASSSVEGVEVAVCPPFTALADVGRALPDLNVAIGLGAQDVFWETAGAYTGEISPHMLVALGCKFVIVGHSERRTLFAEADDVVARKARAALAAGLTPVVCVGESLAERQQGRANAVVERQLEAVLQAVSDGVDGLIIAYEPVWAIGTGIAASAEDAQAMALVIRDIMSRYTENSVTVRILYGGSVNPDNAGQFLSQPDIDGALVGGASLNAEAFASIVGAAAKR